MTLTNREQIANILNIQNMADSREINQLLALIDKQVIKARQEFADELLAQKQRYSNGFTKSEAVPIETIKQLWGKS